MKECVFSRPTQHVSTESCQRKRDSLVGIVAPVGERHVEGVGEEVQQKHEAEHAQVQPMLDCISGFRADLHSFIYARKQKGQV